MQKILLPVDGSPTSLRAVRLVIANFAATPQVHIHLVNVQEPAPAEIVLDAGLTAEAWQAEYQKAGREALAESCMALQEANVPFSASVEVGNAADQIVARARKLGCTQIVMGTRGLSALASLVLGSVATRVVHAADCPVMLVK